MSLANWVELTVWFFGASNLNQLAISRDIDRERNGRRGYTKVTLGERMPEECQGISNFIYGLFLTLKVLTITKTTYSIKKVTLSAITWLNVTLHLVSFMTLTSLLQCNVLIRVVTVTPDSSLDLDLLFPSSPGFGWTGPQQADCQVYSVTVVLVRCLRVSSLKLRQVYLGPAFILKGACVSYIINIMNKKILFYTH